MGGQGVFWVDGVICTKKKSAACLADPPALALESRLAQCAVGPPDPGSKELGLRVRASECHKGRSTELAICFRLWNRLCDA
jgi:hypothetical protein